MTLASGNFGYATWSGRPFTLDARAGGSRIGRHVMHFVADLEAGGLGFDRQSNLYTLKNTLGYSMTQSHWRGGNMPLRERERSVSCPIDFDREEDYYALLEAEALGLVQIFWGGAPRSSSWSIPGGTGSGDWLTGAPLAYDGTRVTKTTHPCRAFVDGVELTVVNTTPASASEVKVPDIASGDAFDTIYTHAGLEGAVLTLRYPSAPYHEIVSVSEKLAGHNFFRCTISAKEKLSINPTLAAVGA